MAKAKREGLDLYYQEASSWARDREDLLRRSRMAAWIVAAVAVVVALCEAIALVALTPLKTVQPYTLLVDRQTGFVQALKPLDAQQIAPGAALTQSFLVQYVIAREGFDAAALQADYRKVALWSSGQARADYLTTMPASNPASPLATYPRSTVVTVEVKSVSPLSASTAMVRFNTRRQDRGGQSQPPQAWVAIIRFAYTAGAMSAGDRFINPLGFQVSSYRRNPEVLPAAPISPPITSAAPGVAPPRSSYPRIVVPQGITP